MRLLTRLLPRIACAALLSLLACVASAAPRIGVMTMQPGEVFFERFGHDALVVADPDTGQATSYNFGFFDPDEPGFLGRFIDGKMMYYLVALPLQQDLESYREEGRGVSLQWLDLTPQQAQALADSLAWRAQPEHARYPYDYFTSNCATQVRDAINAALGGTLKQQLAGRSRGNTYRSESVRLASPAWWMWISFDLGFGPYADQQLSRWEESFVPMRLADALAQVKNTQGRPLVQQTDQLLPHRIAPEPPDAARPWWPWLLAGVAIACALVALGKRHPRGVAAFALPFWLLCTLAGALMLFIWFGSGHIAGWANRNLLLLNPLCVLLLWPAVQLLRGKPVSRMTRWLLRIVAVIALLGWILHWFPFNVQANVAWVALLLPVHLAIAYVFTRQRGLSH
ncbi:DUF4105 domain-containing protein [Pseudoxanthomonas sp.]|uniref:lipoprotein N-acyltransferase Lnb domain-containing protein n=1 Tax=Pseudoxanthomonas sp. TaxID=1871049 RepID=UPI0026043C26|nr:DUF4105 domain-containing protein [Pseudoxanthomonas sp.]WDS36012.1 MAG: DUF4105 domain-containing protein [Pseudoxanthomonas sp.]